MRQAWTSRVLAELTLKPIGSDRLGFQIEIILEKISAVRSFGKISSMMTFNVTSRTPGSALDDSEPTLLLFNRGPGAVLVGVTEIFDRAKAMLLQPRRAPCCDRGAHHYGARRPRQPRGTRRRGRGTAHAVERMRASSR